MQRRDGNIVDTTELDKKKQLKDQLDKEIVKLEDELN